MSSEVKAVKSLVDRRSCVVKNTFLHIDDTIDDTIDGWSSAPASRRPKSEPPMSTRRADSETSLPVVFLPQVWDSENSDQSDHEESHRRSVRKVGTSRSSRSSLSEASTKFSSHGSDKDEKEATEAPLPVSTEPRNSHCSEDPVTWDQGVTTVMVRQIPRHLTQIEFVGEVSRRGFGGLFDFVYLPFDSKKGINVGYGFLNFLHTGHAENFRASFDGMHLEGSAAKNSTKPLRVHPASIQGYEANYENIRHTKTGQKQDPNFSPVFAPGGLRAGALEKLGAASADPMAAVLGLQVMATADFGPSSPNSEASPGSNASDRSWPASRHSDGAQRKRRYDHRGDRVDSRSKPTWQSHRMEPAAMRPQQLPQQMPQPLPQPLPQRQPQPWPTQTAPQLQQPVPVRQQFVAAPQPWPQAYSCGQFAVSAGGYAPVPQPQPTYWAPAFTN